MYIPIIRDAVEIEGRAGLYFVVRTDYGQKVADVIPRQGRGEEIRNVPFSILSAYRPRISPSPVRARDSAFGCNSC